MLQSLKISITGLILISTPFLWAAPRQLEVTLKNAKAEVVGTAKLTQLKNGVRVVLDVRGLPPGEKALHFHETGTCLLPKFDSAGGHFAPQKSMHGFDHAQGPHAGDMPNIYVAGNGMAQLEFINKNVTLANGRHSLLKKGGTAIVIHAGADDYKSQPAGNAGDRIACGEIKAP